MTSPYMHASTKPHSPSNGFSVKPLNLLMAAALNLSLCAGLLTVSSISFGQNYCDEQQPTTKRRRPGQEACVPRPAPSEETAAADETTSEGQRTQARRPGDSQRANAQRDTRPYLARKPAGIPLPGINSFQDSIPVPDRWRLVDSLGYQEHWWDPYNRNTLKGDKPLYDDWFFSTTITSDSTYENRQVPTPVGASSTNNPGGVSIYGDSQQDIFAQTLAMEFVYYKGDTTFRPPDYEFRFIPVLNYNAVNLAEVQGVNPDPSHGTSRYDGHLGIQGAFFDLHLRNVSDNYDFDSLRIGIQPFTADFRGFLFQDSPFGVRLFGTRESNVFQYNIAWFRRLEKDTNSGLNDTGKPLRDDDVFVANLYWQDMPSKGFTSQFTLLHNRNRETEFYYDENDFIARPASLGRETPRTYDVTYLGYNGDGHFGRLNLNASLYGALGTEHGSVFQAEDSDIQAYFAATEASMDFDWIRVRASLVFASGDSNPFDNKSEGYDAVFENPLIAGADTSYWIRQAVPLIGGGRVALSGRNGLLPSLRSSKDEGQSNFTNPGLQMLGLGVDFDLLPQLRLSTNWNALQFADTTSLEVARNQADISSDIGQDVSISLTYRPLNNQNIVLRASYAELLAGDGYRALYKDENPNYLLINLLLVY